MVQYSPSGTVPNAKRLIIGIKYSSVCFPDNCAATDRRESTALSRTTVSSTVDKLSSGG